MFEAFEPAFARQASFENKSMIQIPKLTLSQQDEAEKEIPSIPEQVMIVTHKPVEPAIAPCEKTH